MLKVYADFEKITGIMKPMHGVNSGPKTKVFTYNASELFSCMGIPFCRLHDVEYPYGSGEFVDMHCVFKNPNADENDPLSYDLALTDKYIEAILDVGAQAIYRLGESIEHAPVKRYIYPPKDNAKWARIAEKIIRHYNEGWADGHEWNISYWEIWNEPDLDIAREVKKMWAGSEEQFYDFYETVAKHLKACFPHLKIGGPAIAGNISWAERFLAAMSERNVPIDFFSWHKYSANTADYIKHDKSVRDLLVKYGYENAEIILDEWNYMENWNDQPPSFKKLVGMTGAAYSAACLVTFQHSNLSSAAYFEADVTKEWCGLFEVEDMAIDSLAKEKTKGKLKPRKPYYAFSAFNELYRLENETYSKCDAPNVYACAASNGECSKLMLVSYRSNVSNEQCEINLSGIPESAKYLRVFLTDENNNSVLEKEISITDKNITVSLDLSDEQIRVITAE